MPDPNEQPGSDVRVNDAGIYRAGSGVPLPDTAPPAPEPAPSAEARTLKLLEKHDSLVAQQGALPRVLISHEVDTVLEKMGLGGISDRVARLVGVESGYVRPSAQAEYQSLNQQLAGVKSQLDSQLAHPLPEAVSGRVIDALHGEHASPESLAAPETWFGFRPEYD